MVLKEKRITKNVAKNNKGIFILALCEQSHNNNNYRSLHCGQAEVQNAAVTSNDNAGIRSTKAHFHSF